MPCLVYLERKLGPGNITSVNIKLVTERREGRFKREEGEERGETKERGKGCTIIMIVTPVHTHKKSEQ